MDATEITLAASVLLNLVLVWSTMSLLAKFENAASDGDYWRASATYWQTLFDDLRRNCVVRDPRTGRYVKGYRRHD